MIGRVEPPSRTQQVLNGGLLVGQKPSVPIEPPEDGTIMKSSQNIRTNKKDFIQKETHTMWNLKALSLKEMAELPLPDCGGHECRECIGAFRELWVTKAKFLEIRKALVREKQAMSETIADVEEMEKDYEKRLEEKRVELQVEKEKSAKLSADLEYERHLRVEDFYKAERAGKETEEIIQDMGQYRAAMTNMGTEMQYLRQESDALRDIQQRADLTKMQLMGQIKNYEKQVNDLERANIDLRARTHKTNSQMAEMVQENDLLKLKLSRQAAAQPRIRSSKSDLLNHVDSMIGSENTNKMKHSDQIQKIKKVTRGGAGLRTGASVAAKSGASVLATSSLGQLAQKSGWRSKSIDSIKPDLLGHGLGPGLGAYSFSSPSPSQRQGKGQRQDRKQGAMNMPFDSPVGSVHLGGMMEDSIFSTDGRMEGKRR